ncbi:MAG: DUF1963 domain-containing protein [Pseudomonadota bacterium]
MRKGGISYKWDRPELTEDEELALLFRHRMPAIALLKTPKITDEGTPGCWMGNQPTLPPEIEWPSFTVPNGQHQGLTVPMHCILQINLQYLPRVVGLPELPPKGTFFLFFDPIAAAAPLADPDPLQTGEGVRLIYYPGDVSAFPKREMPPIPDISVIEDLVIYVEEAHNIPNWPIDFVVIDTYESEKVGDALGQMLALYDTQRETLNNAQGWARYSTSRAEDPDEVVFRTLFGASAEPLGPTKEQRESEGKPDFPTKTEEDVLLFRSVGFYAWGDQATSFWIKREDLKNEDFSRVSLWTEQL